MRNVADDRKSFLAVIVISGKLLLEELNFPPPTPPSWHDVVTIIQKIKRGGIENVFRFYSLKIKISSFTGKKAF